MGGVISALGSVASSLLQSLDLNALVKQVLAIPVPGGSTPLPSPTPTPAPGPSVSSSVASSSSTSQASAGPSGLGVDDPTELTQQALQNAAKAYFLAQFGYEFKADTLPNQDKSTAHNLPYLVCEMPPSGDADFVKLQSQIEHTLKSFQNVADPTYMAAQLTDAVKTNWTVTSGTQGFSGSSSQDTWRMDWQIFFANGIEKSTSKVKAVFVAFAYNQSFHSGILPPPLA